jgi:hypothetical protein
MMDLADHVENNALVAANGLKLEGVSIEIGPDDVKWDSKMECEPSLLFWSANDEVTGCMWYGAEHASKGEVESFKRNLVEFMHMFVTDPTCHISSLSCTR